MHKTRSFAFLLAVLIMFAPEPALAGQASAPTIGVCAMATRHGFFRDILDEMRQLAQASGVELIAEDADYDLGRQIAIIEGFISRGVSMIILAPVDSAAIVPTLDKAAQAGIPVMTIDVAAEWDRSISHCASDNVAGGRLAGGMMLEYLEERGVTSGAILILDHTGVTSTEQRIRGFTEVMRLRGQQYQIEVVDAVGQRIYATERTRQAMDRYGDDLAGIFCVNDGTSLGAHMAVEQAGRFDSIVLVGYDYLQELLDAVDKGEFAAVVVQFPRRIGSAAFTVAHDYITGVNTSPPRETLVEVGIYLRDGYYDQRLNLLEIPSQP